MLTPPIPQNVVCFRRTNLQSWVYGETACWFPILCFPGISTTGPPGTFIFFFFFLFFLAASSRMPNFPIQESNPWPLWWKPGIALYDTFAKAHPNVISVTHQSHVCYPLYFLHFRSILLILFLFTTLFPSLHPLYFLFPCIRSIVTVMLESYIFRNCNVRILYF